MTRMMSSTRREALLVGGAAGLVGGLVAAGFLGAQGALASGPFGITRVGIGSALYVLVSLGLGAGFGAVVRYEPAGYAAATGSGLLLGLLRWIVLSLTLLQLFAGRAPAWTLAEAAALYPQLLGDLAASGLTGLLFWLGLTARGAGRPTPEAAAAPEPTATHRVVVLGGGFGGIAATRRLEHLVSHDPGIHVTLVSSSNYLLFTPMLAEVASGALQAQHISTPVRASCPRTRFIRADVADVDLQERAVVVATGEGSPHERIPYDQLILALGSVTTYRGLPGVAEHALSLKTLEDATTLRNHVIETLERADAETDGDHRRAHLTFVVAGGGFAGTEMIAELFDLVHGVLHYYGRIREQEPRFLLVHSGEEILPEIGDPLAGYALRKLADRGIEFVLGASVAEATGHSVLLADGTEIPTGTFVWTAGNRPNPVLERLSCERTRAGALVVDDNLQMKDHPGVWAVGDCAEIPTPEGGTHPPTAQHALREGRHAADNVAAAIHGRAPRPFRFRTIGTFVALGHRTAVAEIRGRRFSGLFAWFLWRGIYLGKLPGVEKKLRVLLDWTIDLLFPRDIVLTSTTLAIPETISGPARDASSGAPERETGRAR